MRTFELIVIGASLGGLKAIKKVLAALPKEFRLPIVVAQHREKGSDGTLRELMQEMVSLPVQEVEDKQPILPGCVYLAPPDYHVLVEKGHFALSTEGAVSYARPSVDALFESAADAYAERVVGVILTGRNQDGTEGLGAIKRRGGLTIVQDPHTAEASSMPEAAAAIPPDRILSLEAIGSFLAGLRPAR